jgi:hypothetical protein
MAKWPRSVGCGWAGYSVKEVAGWLRSYPSRLAPARLSLFSQCCDRNDEVRVLMKFIFCGLLFHSISPPVVHPRPAQQADSGGRCPPGYGYIYLLPLG